MMATDEDRVRQSTATEVNQRLDEQLASRIRLYSKSEPDEINRRIAELDREWDMERVLQTNAATLALLGTILGICGARRWLLLPALVTGFLLEHSIKGWCPPVPVLRRLGVRTRLEIEKERYALQALRGDFEGLNHGENRDVDRLLRNVGL